MSRDADIIFFGVVFDLYVFVIVTGGQQGLPHFLKLVSSQATEGNLDGSSTDKDIKAPDDVNVLRENRGQEHVLYGILVNGV